MKTLPHLAILSLLAIPGVWTAATLLFVAYRDIDIHHPLGNIFITSWLIVVPLTVVTSIIGIVFSVQHWEAGRLVRALGGCHAVALLVAVFLVVIFMSLPNLGTP